MTPLRGSARDFVWDSAVRWDDLRSLPVVSYVLKLLVWQQTENPRKGASASIPQGLGNYTTLNPRKVVTRGSEPVILTSLRVTAVYSVPVLVSRIYRLVN